MRSGSVRILPPIVLGLLPLLAGCGAADSSEVEELGETEQEVVSVGAPVTGPATIAAAPPPTLMFVSPTSSAPADTSANSIHEARFSDGIDLGGAPNTNVATWRTAAIGDAFMTPPAFAARLDEALAAANAEADAVMTPTSAEAGLASLFSVFGGSVSSTVTPRFYGWKTPRARWLSRSGSTHYPDPRLFQEARFRGARQYCSARNLQRKQDERGKISMGERALAALSIFGHTIDLMAVEPTFVLAGPERFTNGGTPDGAQSFITPVLLGSKITPIGNIGLPSMPEVRAPLVFVSADGEVRNDADFHFPTNTFRKTFQTVTHADAVVAREAVVSGGVSGIPLFTIAVVDVEMSVEVNSKIGVSNIGAGDRALDWNVATTHVFHAPGRPLVNDTSVTGFKYNDSPFRILSGTPVEPTPVDPDLSTPGIQFFQRTALGELNMGLIQTTDPMLARSIQDDDHLLDVEQSVGMKLGLQAGVGFDIPGIIEISVDVGGHLEASGGQKQELRDAEIRENQQLASFLTATPRNNAKANYDVYAKLSFKLGPFGFDVPIFDTGPQTFAEVNGPAWPENNRVRMGESAQMGAPMTQPNVSSHLPMDPAGAFPSFPAGNDVNSCLVDTTPNPETPGLCEATPPLGFRPVLNICHRAHAPSGHPFPSNVCAETGAYIDALRASPDINDAQADCIEDMLAFHCQPTSAQIGSNTVSHMSIARPGVDPLDIEAEANALLAILNSCEAPGAFGPGAVESGALFSVGICNDKAQPFTPNQPAFVVTGANTTIRPGTCND